jgi:acid phosphatase family membrane protein YuiD
MMMNRQRQQSIDANVVHTTDYLPSSHNSECHSISFSLASQTRDCHHHRIFHQQ